MTMYGRNDRNVFAALSSEEERRRASEEAAKRPPPFDDDAGMDRDQPPGLTSRILTAIRHAFVR